MEWFSGFGKRVVLGGVCVALAVCSIMSSPSAADVSFDPESDYGEVPQRRLIGEDEVLLVITALSEQPPGDPDLCDDIHYRAPTVVPLAECGLADLPFRLGDPCATARITHWQVSDAGAQSRFGGSGFTTKIDVVPGLVNQGDATHLTLANVNGYGEVTHTYFGGRRTDRGKNVHFQRRINPPTHKYVTANTTVPRTPRDFTGQATVGYEYYDRFSPQISAPLLRPIEIRMWVKGGPANAPLTYVTLQNGMICGLVGPDHLIVDNRNVRPWPPRS